MISCGQRSLLVAALPWQTVVLLAAAALLIGCGDDPSMPAIDDEISAAEDNRGPRARAIHARSQRS
jgi:hypothetical protein